MQSFIFLATCSLSSAKLADWIAALAPPSFTSPSVTDDVVEINSAVAAGGGGAVRDRVLCEHGAERGTPWANIRLAGEGEFGAQDLYVFAAVVDPDARSLLMVAFIKDERPRFLWDHMQTSYDSNAILAGARCEWGSSGVSTAARSTVEISVDGAETLLRPWDGGAVDTWFAKRPTWAPEEVPRFSNVVRVVCDLPADTDENSVSLDPSAEWSVTLRRSGGGAEERRHSSSSSSSSSRRDVDYALPLRLCPRTHARRSGAAVCTQPFRKRCTGKCPGTAEERAAGWSRYIEKLRQWAQYGRTVGIDRVYVYDRDADLDSEPSLVPLFESGLLVHVHWPAFSDDWKHLPLSVIPKGDWNLWDKKLSDTARVDFSMSPDRSSPLFDERANGVVFNKDPIVFDQVIAINHCFYTNRYTSDWLASTDPDEYWHVSHDRAAGSMTRLLQGISPSVAEVHALSLQYGVCASGEVAESKSCAGEQEQQQLVIEKMRCHHPTAEMSEHMKYLARPTLVRFAFIHQVNWMEPGTTRRVLKPWCNKRSESAPCARVNHYTCGEGHAADGLYYAGCNLVERDRSVAWSTPAVREALGWAPPCTSS